MENRKVRLIDANALLADIHEAVVFSGREFPNAETRGARKIIDRIQVAPAIDPESLRPQGKWWFDGEDYFCSRCNRNALCDQMTGEQVLSAFCPNCGAKMDRED